MGLRSCAFIKSQVPPGGQVPGDFPRRRASSPCPLARPPARLASPPPGAMSVLIRRRALTRLALLAAATTAVLVFALVQLLHPLHDGLRSAAAHAAVRARHAVDDAPWAACRVRTDPFVQWRADRRPAVYVPGLRRVAGRAGGGRRGGLRVSVGRGPEHFVVSRSRVLTPSLPLARLCTPGSSWPTASWATRRCASGAAAARTTRTPAPTLTCRTTSSAPRTMVRPAGVAHAVSRSSVLCPPSCPLPTPCPYPGPTSAPALTRP